MPQPPSPNAPGRDSDRGPSTRPSRRFTLTVWPPTAAAPWQAEVSADGVAPPRRFEQPADLLSFLTQSTPPAARPGPGGLR